MLGSTTAPGRPGARAGAPGHVAFHSTHSVGVARVLVSRLNTQPMRTPVTASPIPRGHQRMTRGQCGSLNLHWQRLALFTPCRSPGAPLGRSVSSAPHWKRLAAETPPRPTTSTLEIAGDRQRTDAQ